MTFKWIYEQLKPHQTGERRAFQKPFTAALIVNERHKPHIVETKGCDQGGYSSQCQVQTGPGPGPAYYTVKYAPSETEISEQCPYPGEE